MRLIDADKLKKDLSENYVFYGFRQLLNDFYEALDSAPCIDIVRCGECKYYLPLQKNLPYVMRRYYCNKGAIKATNPDDFCSYGERKEQ